MTAAPTPIVENHPTVPSGRIGALLVNLGTPEGTSYWPMRRYLQEFLSDPRVIEVPRALWLPVLHGVILTTRPTRKGRDYAAIWNNERDEGPLKTVTRAQSEKMAASCVRRIWPGQRKTRGGLGHALRQTLHRLAHHRLAGARLRPAADRAALSAILLGHQRDRRRSRLRRAENNCVWQPTLRIAAPFYDRPAYIAALASSLRESLAKLDFTPDKILISWHGIPKACFDKGDPYFCHCAITTRLLGEATGLADKFLMTFQSRLGPTEWLKPYTWRRSRACPNRGSNSIAIMRRAFSPIAWRRWRRSGAENRDAFLDAGGEKSRRFPASTTAKRQSTPSPTSCARNSPDGCDRLLHRADDAG